MVRTRSARGAGGSWRGVDRGRPTPSTVPCSSSTITHRHVVLPGRSRAASSARRRAMEPARVWPSRAAGSLRRPSQVPRVIVRDTCRPRRARRAVVPLWEPHEGHVDPGIAAVPCRDFVTMGGGAFPLRARGRRAVSAMAQAVEELVGADLAASARVASRLRRSRCCVQVVHDALNCLNLALGDESRRPLLVGLRPDVALAAGPIRAILQCVRVDGGECVVDGLPQGRQRHTGDGG